jgi:release factor glutamine methyltransferase
MTSDSFAQGKALALAHRSEGRSSFELLGKTWRLLEGVFSPALNYSTEFFAKSIPYPDPGSLLEIGSGAGVIAIVAARRGCLVTATDVDQRAVINTLMNAHLHGVTSRVRVYRGDVFDPLPAGERFDAIFWNSPFILAPDRMHLTSPIERAIFDPGYESLGRFLRGCRELVSPRGRVLLGFSSLGDASRLDDAVRGTGRQLTVISSSPDPWHHGVTYDLIEVR